MKKPARHEVLSQRDATDVREARAATTQLPNLPIAIAFSANQEYTFALTLKQADTLFQALQIAIHNAVVLYGIPADMREKRGD